MKACFICETPYQIFNSINFVLNQEEIEFEECDIYIGEKFNGFHFISDALQKEKVFNHIFRYSYKDEKRNFFDYIFFRFFYVITPKKFLKKAQKDFGLELKSGDYTHVFVSTQTRFGMAMIMANPNAKVCFFEDGIGSYVGSIGAKSITGKRKFVYKLLGKDYRHLYPQVMYVNNVNMCETEYNIPIKPLPPLDKTKNDFKEILHRIFKEPIPEYSRLHYVLLSQPIEGEWQSNDLTLSLCKNIGLDFILRPHPRQEMAGLDAPIIDNSGSLWELVCAEQITDDSVLIGRCSTAQYSPKMLFDKEPYIIFTYKLYDYTDEGACDRYHSVCEKVRSVYKNKEKVIEVNNLSEFELVISSIKSQLGDMS